MRRLSGGGEESCAWSAVPGRCGLARSPGFVTEQGEARGRRRLVVRRVGAVVGHTSALELQFVWILREALKQTREVIIPQGRCIIMVSLNVIQD